MRASSIHQFHSGSGTKIFAFGKAASPALLRRPLMWSPWKCDMTTALIDAGSMPAAAMLASSLPPVAAPNSPLPVSKTMRCAPTSTTGDV